MSFNDGVPMEFKTGKQRSGIFRGGSPRQGRVCGCSPVQKINDAVTSVNKEFKTEYDEPKDIMTGGNKEHIKRYNKLVK